jgi:hypothetical protein
MSRVKAAPLFGSMPTAIHGRYNMLIRLVVASVFLLPRLVALGDPLPQVMLASPIGSALAVIFPAADPSVVTGLIRLDTVNKRLLVDWHFSTGGQSNHSSDEYDLSYEPTAVCARAGKSPVFYVAGYNERTGNVLIEEWTIENIVVAMGAPQGGSVSVVTLAKTVRKEMVCCTTTLKPLRMIAYNLPSNRLWLFEEAAPSVVWALDVSTTPSLVPLFDSSTVTQLPQLLSVRSFRIKQAAPDGGGFIFAFFPWRSWKSKFGSDGPPAGTDPVFVIRDSNSDGAFDESIQLTVESYLNEKLYFEEMDPYYH